MNPDTLARLTAGATKATMAVADLRDALTGGVTPLEADVLYDAIAALRVVERRIGLILGSQP